MDGRRTTRDWTPPRGWRLVTYSLIVFAGYAVVGALTLTVGQYAGLASPIWPSAGLALVAVYAWGWRLAPSVLLGSLAANLVTLAREETLTVGGLTAISLIALGAALQAMAGASLVTRYVGRGATFETAKTIVAFLFFAGPVAAIINSSIATFAQVVGELVAWDQILVLWLTWWAGDAIGVVVFAPIILMLLPEQRDVWHGRRLRVAVPMLLGVAIFIGLFVQVDAQERQARDLRLQQRATSAAGELEQNLARHQEALEGVADFIEAVDQELSVAEFEEFSSHALQRLPSLQAVSWNPIVAGESLAIFEAYQREVQGLAEYRVTERNSNGDLIAVSSRSEYIPVGLIEPIGENAAALGFDINSNPTRRDAIEIARELNRAAGTAPIDLVQESGNQAGMLALVPVHDGRGSGQADESIVGFTVGVYRLGDLVDETFNSSTWDQFDIRLVDVTNDAAVVLADRPSVAEEAYDMTDSRPKPMADESLLVFQRNWEIEVTPTSGPLATTDHWILAVLEVVGLVVLFLLQSFVLLVTGMERSATQRAREARIQASHDELTGLVNRRGFILDLEEIWHGSSETQSVSVLMYIDLDRFKSVNDEGGHAVGDRLLQSVSEAMEKRVRSEDTVARLGGDEFAIILYECGLDRGRQIAEAILKGIRRQVVESSGRSFSVGASIGVTSVHPGDEVDLLISRADEAAFEAKRQGGGVCVADHPSNA